MGEPLIASSGRNQRPNLQDRPQPFGEQAQKGGMATHQFGSPGSQAWNALLGGLANPRHVTSLAGMSPGLQEQHADDDITVEIVLA